MSLLESFNVGYDHNMMVVTVLCFDFEGGSCVIDIWISSISHVGGIFTYIII